RSTVRSSAFGRAATALVFDVAEIRETAPDFLVELGSCGVFGGGEGLLPGVEMAAQLGRSPGITRVHVGELARIAGHVVEPLLAVRSLDVLVRAGPDRAQAAVVDLPVEPGVALLQHVSWRLHLAQLGDAVVAGRSEWRERPSLDLRADRRFPLRGGA